MARTPLYSRSPQRMAADAHSAEALAASVSPSPARTARWALGLRQRERWLWAIGALLLALITGWPAWTAKVQRPLNAEQIDALVRESIAKDPLPSAAAAAYAAVLPSVVRVVGEHGRPAEAAASGAATGKSDKSGGGAGKSGSKSQHEKDADSDSDNDGKSVGTGVVIVDKGLILTNLHVVAGAKKITVTFFDGSESEAVVVSLQPKDDLAVLQAKVIPDDLHAATLRSTGGLQPGDEVVAVGFPFGIGPSASAGVISGLKREFRSPEGKRVLSNLIQFDAAANPGNSGGPLVTLDGHVVGIVTAIMNPSQQRTFIGIAFAVPIENAAGAAGIPPF